MSLESAAPLLEAVKDLLLGLFSESELKAFLARDPKDPQLLARLAYESHEELALAAVKHLARKGRLDDDLFERLKQGRDNRAAEIDTLARITQILRVLHGAGRLADAQREPLARVIEARLAGLQQGNAFGRGYAANLRNPEVDVVYALSQALAELSRASPGTLPQLASDLGYRLEVPELQGRPSRDPASDPPPPPPVLWLQLLWNKRLEGFELKGAFAIHGRKQELSLDPDPDEGTMVIDPGSVTGILNRFLQEAYATDTFLGVDRREVVVVIAVEPERALCGFERWGGDRPLAWEVLGVALWPYQDTLPPRPVDGMSTTPWIRSWRAPSTNALLICQEGDIDRLRRAGRQTAAVFCTCPTGREPDEKGSSLVVRLHCGFALTVLLHPGATDDQERLLFADGQPASIDCIFDRLRDHIDRDQHPHVIWTDRRRNPHSNLKPEATP